MVVGRNAGGAALQFIDSHGKGRAQDRCVVFHLMGQFERLAALNGDRGTEHASGVFQHKVHLLSRDFFSGDNQVALVLTILIVDDNYKLSGLEVFNGLFYLVQL